MGLSRILLLTTTLLAVACSEDQTKNKDDADFVPVANQIPGIQTDALVTLGPIEIYAPPNISVAATGAFTQVDIGFPLVINPEPELQVTNNAPLNGFPIGETIVVWTVVNGQGHSAQVNQFINVQADIGCESAELFFKQRLWPLLESRCLECHGDNIVNSNFNLASAGKPNYLSLNYFSTEKVALLKDDFSNSLLLSKISNKLDDHIGGEIIAESAVEYALFKSMVQRFSSCGEGASQLSDLVLITPRQQLRKSTLALLDRPPTDIEYGRVDNRLNDADARVEVMRLIENMLKDPAFYRRLGTIFNDLLLTDAYKADMKALSLPLDNYVNGNYFEVIELRKAGYDVNEMEQLRNFANYGIAHSTIALINYVVKSNLPFTDILTADYVMVNAYSAAIFDVNVPGFNGFRFQYGDPISQHDETKFLPAQVLDSSGVAIPHSGLLTALPFLARYPSSATNINRKRSKTVFKYFLNTDIEGLANRASLDLEDLKGEWPTLQDPQCKNCHDVMDPVAGLFKNWGNKGEYLGDNQEWGNRDTPPSILPPGYSLTQGVQLPDAESNSALRWLAKNIVNDSRFSESITKILFYGITGISLENDPQTLQSISREFENSNYKLKDLVKWILSSDYFLASNTLDRSPAVQFYHLGTAKLLTPEQLHFRIESIFNGYQWRSPSGRTLLDQKTYNLLYGGIDSNEVLERTTVTTPIMAGVQLRLANQLACSTVASDFSLPAVDRRLFPWVEITFVPENPNHVASIKRNIQFLYQKLHGMKYLENDPVITRAYELFSQIKRMLPVDSVVHECRGDLQSNSPIVIDNRRTVRAWTALVSFLVRDYHFLYE